MPQILEELAVQIRADLGNYEQTFQKAAAATRSLDTAVRSGSASTNTAGEQLQGYANRVAALRDRLQAITPATQAAANGTRQLAVATNGAARSQNALRQSAQHLTSVSSGLDKVLRRVAAAALLFVSAAAIKRFFTDSVRQFVENTKEAAALREQLDRLRDAWFQLKASIGAILVDLSGAATETSTVTDKVVQLREQLEIHRAEIVAWAKVVGTVLTEVGRGVAALARIAFNVGNVIGRAVDAMVSSTVGGIVAVVQEGIDGFNDIISAYNKIPAFLRPGTGDVPLVPRGRDAGDLFAHAKSQLGGIPGDLEDIDAAILGMAGSWGRVGDAVDGANAAGESAIRTFTRVDEEGRKASKAQIDAVARIKASLDEARREINAMAAATAGTSIEYDKARELASALESAIRALSRETSVQAQVLAAELIPEWQALEAQMDAAAAAAKRAKQAQEQAASQRATRREFVSRHEEAVAGFRARQEQMEFDIALQEMEEMRDLARDIAGSFAEGFQSIVNGTETVAEAFRKMAQDIIASIQQILIKKALIDPLISALFPTLEQKFATGIDLGVGGIRTRASGGPVSALSPYLVGEQGPELFVPASAGRIVPNSAMQASGQSTEVHIQQTYEIRAIDTREASVFIRQMQPEIAAAAARGIRQAPGLAAMVRR